MLTPLAAARSEQQAARAGGLRAPLALPGSCAHGAAIDVATGQTARGAGGGGGGVSSLDSDVPLPRSFIRMKNRAESR
jgi:hypothetical protein